MHAFGVSVRNTRFSPRGLWWTKLHWGRFIICFLLVFGRSYIEVVAKKGKVVSVLNYLCSVPWRRMGKMRYSYIILDLCTRWRWVVAFTLLPLYPRREIPRYPLDRRLGGSQSRSGRRIFHCQESNPCRLAYSLSLYRVFSTPWGSWLFRQFIDQLPSCL
jgi:hypothetical protein